MEQPSESSDWANRTRQGRLELLVTEAEQLAGIAKSAYASRDQARPLISGRDELKQQLSNVNSRIQGIPRSHEPMASAKLRRESGEIQLRLTQLTEQIKECYEPFEQFERSVSAFLGRLRSTLMFVKTAPAKDLREDIENLPLLKRGPVGSWTDARDNFTAIRMCLDALIALEFPSAKVAESTHAPAGRLSERDRVMRDEVTTDVVRILSNTEIIRRYLKQLRKRKEFKSLTQNALRSAINRIRRAEHLPSSLEIRKRR